MEIIDIAEYIFARQVAKLNEEKEKKEHDQRQSYLIATITANQVSKMFSKGVPLSTYDQIFKENNTIVTQRLLKERVMRKHKKLKKGE